MRSSLIGALATALVPACGGHAPVVGAPVAAGQAGQGSDAPDEYRAVHVDTLAPDKVGQFIDGRRAWVAALDAAHTVDGRGVFLQVGDHQFYNLRTFTRFGDFDTRPARLAQLTTNVPKAAGDAYDHASDTALVFPHTSEIWQLDRALSYAPAAGALDEVTAAVGRLEIDDVRPDPDDETRYWDAIAEEDRALAEAHYPLTRLGFRTAFGAGHVYALWLAHDAAELDRAPSVEAAIAGVRGAARAAELEARIAAATAHREVLPVIVRRDLTRLAPMP